MSKSVFAIAFAAFALVSSAAVAADLLPYGAPARGGVYSWQGPYIGANLGYQWGSVSNSPVKPSGVAGGVQAGYNVQHSQFVFGGETDMQLTDADDRFAPWKFSNPWFGTLRARAGFAMNSVMFYGTVGLAYGSMQLRNTLSNVTESHTNVGWAGGLGAEMALTGNWTARAEYLYVDLGSSSFVLDGTSHGIQSNILRVGVNYRF
ncbi:MAG: porin family protein [Alphaproteobacteria bacterium]|nr:porin family protein [Alphaproteobacteria bacterium]